MLVDNGPDWEAIDNEVRDFSAGEFEFNDRFADKLVRRAVNKSHLTIHAKPNREDRGIFIGALFQRYIEAMDSLQPEDERRQIMLARLALNIDGLRGVSMEDLLEYRAYIPDMKNVVSGWSDAAKTAAELIRDDLGAQGLGAIALTHATETEDLPQIAVGEGIIEGFENLRETIIDLVYDESADDMHPDMAAALLVALGIDKPAQSVGYEKLKQYKDNALRWLGKRVSYVDINNEGASNSQLDVGRRYLIEIAKRYPHESKASAAEWLAKATEENDPAAHVESYMAYALHTILRGRKHS